MNEKLQSVFNLKTLLIASLAATVFTACDKGGGSFSVLTDSSNFQNQVTYSPRKLDVIFVVDNSGSMGNEQADLAVKFPAFINRFINRGYDFRIGVTTTDAYLPSSPNFFQGNGSTMRVIEGSPETLDTQAKKDEIISNFSANVKVGTSGSGTERGLASFKKILEAQGATFHRPGAYLAIVIVSDEEDTDNTSLSTFTNFLTAGYGASTTDHSVSVIVKKDNTCTTADTIGYRYMDVATATGGSKTSICDDFSTTLDQISTTIANQTKSEFFLKQKPIVSTIRVVIDGSVVPQSNTNGWSYDAVKNSIKINGSSYPIVDGTQISIVFDPDING